MTPGDDAKHGMDDQTGARVFLFLEGPHGRFYRLLAQCLIARGAAVRRVLFNAADLAEWGDLPASRFTGPAETFEDWLAQLIDALGVTDLVVYGDGRRIHQSALHLARQRGITTHILEEGYIRPRFVTYEREGTNAYSRLCDISLPRMAGAIGQVGPPDETDAGGDTWGDSRQHLWLSCLYYLRLMLSRGSARSYGGARGMPMWREIGWYVLRALALPYIRLRRWAKKVWLIRSQKTFHLVLLQLSFDASMRVHSDYENTADFIEEVIDAFAESAVRTDYLVFKAHPFENGRGRLGKVIRALAKDLGVADRVVFIDGGKRLAALMDAARSVVTVNSTGAQQALWRGLPVVATGRSIYRKPGLVSEQSLPGFFRHPRRPDLRAYWIFRAFMIRTTQLPGSFYAMRGIRRLLEDLPDAMMRAGDAYDDVLQPGGGSAEHPTLSRPSLAVSNVEWVQNLH
ncbi:MAG: capsule biosynthesis protein CapA [Pseudomonadota bacterium]